MADVVRTHDSAEAARLLKTGGRLRRLAHDMAVDLDAVNVPAPHVPPLRLLLGAVDGDVDGIAVAAAAAVLPGHVDDAIWSGVDRAEYWRQLLHGTGPCGAVLLAQSRLVRDTDGAIAAAVVVTTMPATEWWAGDPWIPEIFVIAPFQGRGLGGLLLGHAVRMCGDAGYQRLGLTVSEGNPARRLYERFGFGHSAGRGSSIWEAHPAGSSVTDPSPVETRTMGASAITRAHLEVLRRVSYASLHAPAAAEARRFDAAG
jgi:mycothiol synthase